MQPSTISGEAGTEASRTKNHGTIAASLLARRPPPPVTSGRRGDLGTAVATTATGSRLPIAELRQRIPSRRPNPRYRLRSR